MEMNCLVRLTITLGKKPSVVITRFATANAATDNPLRMNFPIDTTEEVVTESPFLMAVAPRVATPVPVADSALLVFLDSDTTVEAVTDNAFWMTSPILCALIVGMTDASTARDLSVLRPIETTADAVATRDLRVILEAEATADAATDSDMRVRCASVGTAVADIERSLDVPRLIDTTTEVVTDSVFWMTSPILYELMVGTMDARIESAFFVTRDTFVVPVPVAARGLSAFLTTDATAAADTANDVVVNFVIVGITVVEIESPLFVTRPIETTAEAVTERAFAKILFVEIDATADTTAENGLSVLRTTNAIAVADTESEVAITLDIVGITVVEIESPLLVSRLIETTTEAATERAF